MPPTVTTLTTPTILLWVLHWIAATIWIAGAILLGVWAIRSLPAPRLGAWGTGLFIAGVLVTILTVPAAITGLQVIHRGGANSATLSDRMMTMMQMHDAGSDPTAHAQHQQMETLLRGAGGDDLAPPS